MICEEEISLSLDELILVKNFLNKVNNLRKSINDINQIEFFFLCKSCNIAPKMLLKDNENILFQYILHIL